MTTPQRCHICGHDVAPEEARPSHPQYKIPHVTHLAPVLCAIADIRARKAQEPTQ